MAWALHEQATIAAEFSQGWTFPFSTLFQECVCCFDAALLERPYALGQRLLEDYTQDVS